MEFDKDGIICPYNPQCRCQIADCDFCGWNPAVSERRIEALLQEDHNEEDEAVKRIVDLNPIIKELADWCLVTKGLECSILGTVIDKLRSVKSVDAVEVIRCKECQFCSYNSSNDTYKCRSMRGMYRMVAPEEFCSWGERKNDG